MTRSFFITLAALFLTIQSSFALRGGPFDHNSSGGRASGIYQAVYSFTNGNGIVRFNDDVTADITSRSDAVIFSRGVLYIGNAFGTADFASSKVYCTTTGNSRNGTSINVGTVTSSFIAKIKDSASLVRFAGRGELHFFASVAITQPGPTGDFGMVQRMKVNGTRINVQNLNTTQLNTINSGTATGGTGTGTGGTGTGGVTIN